MLMATLTSTMILLLLQIMRCYTQVLSETAKCAEKCDCHTKITISNDGADKSRQLVVDCSNQKLESLPDVIPDRTGTLILQRNSIKSIQMMQTYWDNISHLDLSYNAISELGDHAIYQQLHKLRVMNLANNHIQQLHAESFANLSNLVDLNLANNVILAIEDDSFRGLIHLETLVLSGNRISILQSIWFTPIPSLRVLMLDGNNISEIADRTFESLHRLNQLSMSDNHVRVAGKHTFARLSKLQHLNLNRNQLENVPWRSFAVLQSLQLLSLDGNPLTRIAPHDFNNLPVTEICLRNMPRLEVVDEFAFRHLITLHTLLISNNSNLAYIDSAAFMELPQLHALDISGCRISSLPVDLSSTLPMLGDLHLDGNPIQCDCNLHWLDGLESDGLKQVLCNSPSYLQGTSVLQVNRSELGTTCTPTMLPFFRDSSNKPLGSTVRYRCRAIGGPPPHISWMLADGSIVNGTSNRLRASLEESGRLLVIHAMKPSDAGIYSCLAHNRAGYASASTKLRLHSDQVKVWAEGVASDFITMTWSGTGRTIASAGYVLQWWRATSSASPQWVRLQSYMHTYTISDLQPHTSYRFCIAYAQGMRATPLDCIRVTTRNEAFRRQGIRTLDTTSAAVVLCVLIACLLTICVVIKAIKWHRKHTYKTIDDSRRPQCRVVSSIPLDRIEQGATTQLSTSKTCLVAYSPT